MSQRIKRELNDSLNATHRTNNYLDLPQPDDKIQAEYIWIDDTGQGLRSKTRTISNVPNNPSKLPVWTYDGSFVHQIIGVNTEITLRPVAIYKDPFRRNNNILVLCESYKFDNTPMATNKHLKCKPTTGSPAAKKAKPSYVMEQNYTFLDMDGRPLGWPTNGLPRPQCPYSPYYCGVGADKVSGRTIVEAHYRACLYAGIEISGSNAEVAPSQWKYQIGSSKSISVAKDLWVSRFILHRIAEDYGVAVTLHPKPLEGYWKNDERQFASNHDIRAYNEFSVDLADERTCESCHMMYFDCCCDFNERMDRGDN